MAAETVMAPVHPGEILLEEFLGPLGVSQYQLAKAVDVPARRINEIVHGQRRISADTALTARPLLRHLGEVLDKPAGPLRPRGREGPAWRGTRRHPAPERHGLTPPRTISLNSPNLRATVTSAALMAGLVKVGHSQDHQRAVESRADLRF